MARFKVRRCDHCGNLFQKTHHRQIYCSTGCRFWAKVRVLGPDDCWEWQATRTKFGHGQFSAETGKPYTYAHRYAWATRNGDAGDRMVCHECDNPPCVNPGHLFLGDQKVNMSDCARKGRTCKGAAVPKSKLSDDDIRAIRIDPRPNRTIAAEFGIAAPTVSKIKLRQRWSHI